MAFTIDLTIRGLCALVTKQPINYSALGEPGQSGKPGAPQDIDEITVLIMDARKATTIPSRDDPSRDLQVCGHLPMLRYSNSEAKKLNNFLLLEGHQIEILNADGSVLNGGVTLDPSFKDWIPMDLVLWDKLPQNPNAARIDPQFLAGNFPPDAVVGRLTLKSGLVKAQNVIGIWDFLPSIPNLDADQFRFASELVISIEIMQQKGLLRATSKSGSRFEQELKPRQSTLSGNWRVNLLLSNLCFEDEEQDRPPRLEEDFAVFYKLLPNYSGVRRVPRLVAGGGGQGKVQGGANDSPSCTGMVGHSQ